VVHDGALRDGGMVSFARYLSVKDVEDVRSFIVTDYMKTVTRPPK
jgi:hypothetical protein